MSRYNSRQGQRPLEPSYMNRKIHPVWRGVGFALMVLGPVIGYFTALMLLEENGRMRWVDIPANLLVQWQDPLILVKILMTIFISLIIYAFFTFLYFIIARIFAPSRYGPHDVPPIKYKGKPYRR
jgi:hypothetical protein